MAPRREANGPESSRTPASRDAGARNSGARDAGPGADQRPENPADDLGLEQFLDPTGDEGLSLDALSRTYAELLGSGDDPYAAPEDPDDEDSELSEEPPGEEPEASERAEAPVGEDRAVTPLGIVEAMLFVGHPENVPLTSKQIAALMRGVSPREIEDLVAQLNRIYEEQRSAYQVNSVGAGYRLELRPELAPLRDKFHGQVKAARLSQQAIDVLAIVAYNQPIARDDVERLRGRPVGGVLSQLVRRQLLALERGEKKSRQPIYRTTDRFLELFGLESLEDLPRGYEAERR